MEHTDCCFLFDNEALYGISTRSLGIEKPSYESINRLIAQVISTWFRNSLCRTTTLLYSECIHFIRGDREFLT